MQILNAYFFGQTNCDAFNSLLNKWLDGLTYMNEKNLNYTITIPVTDKEHFHLSQRILNNEWFMTLSTQWPIYLPTSEELSTNGTFLRL